MSMYTNAIESIQVGVEDYKVNEAKRSKSAIRNILAGILLLYKEKLCQLSPAEQPELLARQNIKPVLKDGELIFIGTGNTANIDTIKTRFKDFNIYVEWKRFDEVSRLRQKLEHYYTEESAATVRELIASSFLLIRDFITTELKEDPIKELGLETWEVLLEVNEIYMAEKQACDDSLTEVDWKFDTIKDNLEYLRCEECESALVHVGDAYVHGDYPDVNLRCKQCSNEFMLYDVLEVLVEEALKYEMHFGLIDGGEPPYDSCPSCGLETYVFDEGCCVNCEYVPTYTECTVCGAPVGLHEQDNGGLCDYHRYQYDKVMRE